ncbi:MAG TPA: LLM class flavin-dependent oxidoreductase [Tepidiformaceae bacterium]|nr:LLM class flavin-dependent oxidoreductase [Tepidiformaceae bacterium]
MPNVHFGVTVPQIKRTWDESVTASREFEAMGYDSLWVCDHLYGPQSPQIPILEAWSLLAGLAAATEKVELGTLVTPAGMRNAAHLGKVIATVDNIAGGRVIPGLGGGWMQREFTDFGVPFLQTKERLGQLRETVTLLKRMWTEDEVTFDGKYIQAEHLVCEPKPPRKMPILIGGGGEQVTMKLAAKEADIWNNQAVQQARLPHKIDVLKQHCADIGRPFEEVTVSQQCLVTIAPDEDSAGPMIATAKKIFGGHLGDPEGPLAIAGSPARVKEQIQKHIDLGCTMFLMEFFGRDTREPAALFAEQVLPSFK